MSVGVEENRGDEEEGHRHHGRQAAEQREQKLQKSIRGVEEARARTTGSSNIGNSISRPAIVATCSLLALRYLIWIAV